MFNVTDAETDSLREPLAVNLHPNNYVVPVSLRSGVLGVEIEPLTVNWLLLLGRRLLGIFVWARSSQDALHDHVK